MASLKTSYYDALNTQFNNFTSIDFVRKASNLIEKVIWITIAIIGTIWIGKILYTQLDVMNDFPVLKTKESMDLLKMTSPAITFCPKMASEYSVAEGLGNYLDLNKRIPHEAILIRNEAAKLHWENILENYGCDMTWTWTMVNSLANYYYNCCSGQLWCKVNFIFVA